MFLTKMTAVHRLAVQARRRAKPNVNLCRRAASSCSSSSGATHGEERWDYASLTEEDVSTFRAILGEDADSGVVTDVDDLAQYNTDWLRQYHGKSRLALRPRTTEQVSSILRHCSERRLAVVPQGGNTGLVGGSVPVRDEVVLSLQLMREVENFDPVSGIVTCQAG